MLTDVWVLPTSQVPDSLHCIVSAYPWQGLKGLKSRNHNVSLHTQAHVTKIFISSGALQMGNILSSVLD